jgi:hypothetical protein
MDGLHKITLALIVCLVGMNAFGLTVTSDVESVVSWSTDDSPVVIEKTDFTIATNGHLRIAAGVEVFVSNSIDVQGTLEINGTANERVVVDKAAGADAWGPLKFSLSGSETYRTNTVRYADLRNMDSYIYLSQQSLTMEHSTMVTTSSGWYGLAAYVNAGSGNPASIALVSNTFSLMIPRHGENRVTGILMDGFQCRLAYNTISLLTTGTIQEVEGLRFYRSNTTAFEADLIGNTIEVNSAPPGDTLQVYGLRFDSSASGLISNNTIAVEGPQSLTGIDKIDDRMVYGNTIRLLNNGTDSYGYITGIKSQATAADANDLLVNNDIEILSTNAATRYLTGIYCQEGRTRGNRIRIRHGGDGGYVRGISQVYYEGTLDANSISLQVADTNLIVYGIDLSTHYNSNAVIYLRNNLLYSAGSQNSAGLRRDSGCDAAVSNEYNLVYGFNTAFSNCTAGSGAVQSDPLFADEALHLAAGSPAVNAGTNQVWMSGAVDLDNDARIDQEIVDIGCDEYHVLVTLTATAASPVRASSFVVEAAFNEAVGGFTAGDLTVLNGSVSNFAIGMASNYSFDVHPATVGTVSVQVVAGAATNAAGVSNSRSEVLQRTYNPNPPDLSIVSLTMATNGVAAGGTFDVSVVISNAAGPTEQACLLSLWKNHATEAEVGETGDVSRTVAPMAAGETRSVEISGIAAGSSYGARVLRAFVDSDGAASESVETNNQQVLPYVVYGNGSFSLSAFALTNSVVLRWNEPLACGHLNNSVHLRYHPGRYPVNTNDGTACYTGTNRTFVHTNLSSGLTYWYTIWVTDDGTNYVAP